MRRLRRKQPFLFSGIIMAMLIIIPLLFSLNKILETSDKWPFIVEQLLMTYVSQTLILVVGVITLSSLIGGLSAFVIATYQFKGRRLLEILFYLPMAVPPYALSYIYVDSLSYQGRLYRMLSMIGIDSNINVFSMGMAIMVLSLTLSPYIYIPLLAYLKNKDVMYEDAAKLLHKSWFHRMRLIHVPMMLPTLLSAGMFVLFESLNDYGVSKYLNIKTLSVGMFDAWFQLNDMTAAFYVAFIYIGVIIGVSIMYQLMKKNKNTSTLTNAKKSRYQQLQGWQRYVFPTSLWIIITWSLFWPMTELVLNIITSWSNINVRAFFHALWNTLMIASIASGIIIVTALFVGNFYRFARNQWVKKVSSIFVIGYALPGVMIALIYYVFFIQVDQFLLPLYGIIHTRDLVLSLSIWMLISAFVFRFFAIGFRQVIVSYETIGQKHTLASYTLHMSKLKTLWFVDIPLIKKGLIAGFIISFVDIAKELPMTLLLRPYNTQTLSTLTFTYVNNEDIAGASLPSLVMIVLSAILILILTSKRKDSHVS